MSFRLRIALLSAAAVAVAIAVAALVTFTATKRELIAEVDASLHERVERIERVDNLFELIAVLNPVDARLPRGPFERGMRGFDAIFWQFVPAEGGPAITDFPGGLPVGAAEEAVIAGRATLALRTVNVGDDNLRVLTYALPTGAVQVARSLAEVDNSLAGLASTLRLAAVFGALLAGLAGYLVARGAARPIGQLAAAAEHVAATQELAARIDVDRNDEVGRLAHSFNAMLAALQRSRDQQHRLVHDAGHELRTPLTALRTNIEVLARADELPEIERAAMLADIDSELQELTALVAELVELASESASEGAGFEELDLGELVERVAQRYRRRTGRTITVTADQARVKGRRPDLERAVSNLVDNALKWSPPDSPIAISVAEGRVAVQDHGPGIDEADREFVFDRFYRAVRDRSTPGSGLGLSIVAKVAAAHDGSVFVGAPASGALVGFEVPVVDGDLAGS